MILGSSIAARPNTLRPIATRLGTSLLLSSRGPPSPKLVTCDLEVPVLVLGDDGLADHV